MIHRKTKIIFVLSLLFFIGCVGAAGMFVSRVNAEKAAYLEKRAERTAFLEREQSLSQLQEALEATREERASLETRILPDDVISFLALVENMGREQQVELITSALTVSSVNVTFEELFMSIQVAGSYEAVTHMITLFEHLPYQSSLGNLYFSKEGERNDRWRAGFELRVTKFKKI